MAQPQQDRQRYTDKDIRADYPRLSAIATAYLAGYTGSFDPLRAAKHEVQNGHDLSVQQLRIVCNTMIQDYSVHNMPEPKGHLATFDAGTQYHEDDDDLFNELPPPPRARKKSHLKVARPVWFELNSRFNPANPFWYSTLNSAYVIHVAESIKVEYHTEAYYADREWYKSVPPFEDRFSLRPRAACKDWRQWPRGMRVASLEKVRELLADTDRHRRWCGTCRNVLEKANWTPPGGW